MGGTGEGTQLAAVQTAQSTQNSSTQTAQGAQSNGVQTQGKTAGFDFNNPEIQTFLQSEIDRATNKLGNDNKLLRVQLEQLRQSKLSDDELKEAAITQREQDLAEREAQLKTEKNRMYAIGKIKAAGLDDGTETALGLINLVMADEEKDINANVASLSDYVKKLVAAGVNKAFAESGRQPGGSNEPVGGDEKKSKAVELGKKAAATDKAAKKIMDYYIGR